MTHSPMLNLIENFITPVLIGVYGVAVLALTLYAGGYIALLIAYVRQRHNTPPLPAVDNDTLPTIAVQLPLYNERAVASRLVQAVAQLDYPRHKLTVQVLDDSTDDTPNTLAPLIARLRGQGVNIAHIRRGTRTGYKAGALAYGLTLTDAELIAVFDADFVPEPDFLRRTVPHFSADAKLGIVQTRWGHLNPRENLLTQAQALAIDAHFIVEQTARSRAGWLTTFNGTGGVWRRTCIESAGGWQWDTLTEDLDLSYRAQIEGWRYLFLPDVVVRGEVPAHIDTYRQQQARWAQGTTQTLLKLVPRLRDPRLTWGQRLMALHQLGQYLPPLALLLMFLLSPLMLIWQINTAPLLTPLGVLGIAPLLIHALAQGYTARVQPAPMRHWLTQMSTFPLTVILGAGVVWNNARASWRAFGGGRRGGEFIRTPKRGIHPTFTDHHPLSIWGEVCLFAVALVSIWVSGRVSPTLIFYPALYALAVGAVIVSHLYDRWRSLSARQTRKNTNPCLSHLRGENPDARRL